MPTSLLKSLSRFSRYQRVLVFGAGLLGTAMVLLAFAAETQFTLRNHLAEVNRAFDTNRHLLLVEMVDREDAFHTALIGAEWTWRIGATCDLTIPHEWQRYRQFLLQPTLTAPPQWIIGTNHNTPSDDEVRRFVCLAAQVGHTAAVNAHVHRGELPAYLYSLQNDLVSIIPAPEEWARTLMSTNRDSYMNELRHGIDPRLSLADNARPQARRPLRWTPPRINPLTGKPVVRIVGDILDNGAPFASLAMEYDPATLLEPLKANLQGNGIYLIVSSYGDIIATTNPGAHTASAFDPASLEEVPLALRAQRFDRYLGGNFVVSQRLALTNWTLVYLHPWRDIWSALNRQMILSAAIVAGLLATLWILLFYFKVKVFRPLIESSRRVFESERLSRVLIETAPVGLGLISADTGRALLCSPSMQELAKRISADAPVLEEELVRRHKQRLASGDTSWRRGAVQEDMSFPTQDGSTVDLLASVSRVRYKDRDVLMTAFSDVTAKKRLEDQLRQAKHAADAANAAKSAFVATMSHEIRTPLNAILGNLELAARSATSPMQRDRLNTIREASNTLLAIVNNVLDFSKIEAGELSIEHIDFDVQAVAARSLRMFSPLAKAKGLTLLGEMGLAVRLPVNGDPTRLGQVINNLLSNAIKFTETGQVALRLRLGGTPCRLRVEVEDTGIGIAPEYLSDVFRAFSQADATISRRYGGTGLGLALCSGLANAMGGHLSAHSEPGVGSRFVLELPMAVAELEQHTPRFEGQSAVLVSAQESGRSYVEGALQAWGLTVRSYPHPTLVDRQALHETAVLIIWGDRDTWHADDENDLIEEARWVIDCSSDGPSEPLAAGRLLSASVFSLRGLAVSLQYCLQGIPLTYPEERQTKEDLLARSLHVLVVDDNSANRELLDEQLTLLGCKVCLTENGEAALSCMAREPFDVVLTDLSMPGMDGYELARRVHERWPATPVMAITANVTPQAQALCVEVGMARLLRKPLALAELEEALSTVGGVPQAELKHRGSQGLLGERDLPEDLKDAFRASCEASLLAIRRARQIADLDRLQRELHTLSGTFGVFRMQEEAQLCRNIEQALLETGLSANAGSLEALCQRILEFTQQGASRIGSGPDL